MREPAVIKKSKHEVNEQILVLVMPKIIDNLWKCLLLNGKKKKIKVTLNSVKHAHSWTDTELIIDSETMSSKMMSDLKLAKIVSNNVFLKRVPIKKDFIRDSAC